MKKTALISFVFFFFLIPAAFSQVVGFSLATDLGLQRSFKKGQRFWAGGHTVQTHFHFSPKEGGYFWFSYYSPGNFKNNLAATAKSALTIPQQINYVNKAVMRFKQLSLGWKHYLKGNYDNEDSWSLYALGGFGLILGSVNNEHSVKIDTSLYNVPVRSGKANFKRLTLDLALGWEAHLGGAIFFYNEGRVWIPTTDYPSKYLFINRDAPLVATLNFGIRVLFD